MTAKEIMREITYTVKKDTPIKELIELLLEKDLNGVPVVEDEKVIGMVTQKDLLHKEMEPRFPIFFELLGGIIPVVGTERYNSDLRKLTATKVADIMSKEPVTAEPDESVEKVSSMMVEFEVEAIPVTENGRLLGMISRRDIIAYLADLYK